ncbi:predicted protein [Uncinocarpus reesii 1704]|uniref:EKC/KEOPS complex subunit BUD32 n=1 Tax=Uncinocarpus reesii (strain UAMH 1704) TaxID=336963 RepID=C4JZ98_UNCRE|nr:uncharacterized protein UREG_07499 [Uncinocarpus reesii 1704]EEP82634.1 predicted protein [Uncinocarpus reesii 1704]
MAISAPFSSLTDENQIATGSASVVYSINGIVALKCPIRYASSSTQHEERQVAFLRRQSEISVNALEIEKGIFTVLEQAPHPNIVRCFLFADEGIFLERLATPLNVYLESVEIVPQPLKIRWLLELTSAVAWIEKLGFIHGDLRPENMLLTENHHLKLVDFDCAVTPGENLQTFSEPYWLHKPDGSLDRAGPKSEQFALGSCLYFIFHETEPVIDIVDGQLDFPGLSSTPFAPLIQKCWDGGFLSVRKLALAALWNTARSGHIRVLLSFLYSSSIGFRKSRTSCGKIGPLKKLCQEYLDEQRRVHLPSLAAPPQAIDIRRS